MHIEPKFVGYKQLTAASLVPRPSARRGRPGTHCLRMREFYECACHEKLWAFTETAFSNSLMLSLKRKIM